MPDFHHVEHATGSPTMCILCGEAVGPFIDTGVQKDGYGRIWICASNGRRSGCSRQIGRLDGLFEPYSIEEINTRLEAAIDASSVEITRVINTELGFALDAAERFKDLVEELAKSKLVPALEVYELGRAARDE